MSAWGDAWGAAWGDAWGSIGAVQQVEEQAVAFNAVRRKKKRPRIIRYSDFESREAYRQEVMAAMEVVPAPVEPPKPQPIEQPNMTDEDVLVFNLMRLLP